jgi:putative membrane protein
MTEERHVNWSAELLASERTLLAAERTFSAWIRTGLAAIGGGLAVARVLVFKSHAHELLAHAIGGLLVVWGASVFIHAIVSYQHTCKKLSQEGPFRNSLGAMKVMTATLLVIAALVLWITLP